MQFERKFMTHQNSRIVSLYSLILILLYVPIDYVNAQQDQNIKDQYRIGPDERLMITVHVIGEVQRPGEYLVPDDTNVLELISKASGPTEYSNLNNVKITRGLINYSVTKGAKNKAIRTQEYKKVIKLQLKKILYEEGSSKNLPILQPGDVVTVGRNKWFTWQTIIRVISQLAIVAQVWYWYNRVD